MANSSHSMLPLPSNTSLLPIEQPIQTPNHEPISDENTLKNMLDGVERQRNVNINVDSQAESPLGNLRNNEQEPHRSSEDTSTNIERQLQNTIGHILRRSKFQQRLKRSVYIPNPFYISRSINKSIFNESPTNKRARTRLFNSPASTSLQSPVETRAPSPLPIPHEFEFNPLNKSTTELNASFDPSITLELSVTASNENVLQTRPNDLLSFEIQEKSSSDLDNDLMEINIYDYDVDNLPVQCNITVPSTSTPISNVEQNIQSRSNEQINDEENLQSDSNIELVKDGGQNNTNIENTSEGFNEASTSGDANNQDVYVLRNDQTHALGTHFLESIHLENSDEEERVENEVEIDKYFFEMIANEIANGSKQSVEGVYYKKEHKGWWATIPKLDENMKIHLSYIGNYATLEVAARVRDLVGLKLNKHTSNEKFSFHFPISDYADDLKEMKNWTEKDYIWSLKRQSLGFQLGESGFKGVYSLKQKNPLCPIIWKGTLPNVGKIIKNFNKNVCLGTFNTKEIPAIFCDLVNLHQKGWDFVTNFRPGIYSQEDVNKFIGLLENNQQKEACEWDLIKRILEEELPSNKYIVQENTLIQSVDVPLLSTNNVLANNSTNENWQMPPQEMAWHFMECPWKDLETLWKSLRKASDDCDLIFEKTLVEKYGASIWAPFNLSFINIDVHPKIEYNFFFPCVIATTSSNINVQRRILGFDFIKYKTYPYDNCIENHQKQWINLPSIRYLPHEFKNIIACNGGLLVVKGGKQPQQLNNQTEQMSGLLASHNHCWELNEFFQAKNQSIIIVTNPLTYGIKSLPPMPHKVLRRKAARLNFEDNTRTTYRLIVVGVHHDEPTIQGIQTSNKKELALAVYCSIQNSWVHFDYIEDVGPLPENLGRPSVVVHGCSIYYGGVKISSPFGKKQILIPTIFYFNTSNLRKQCLTFDFSKAGDLYFVKRVEPPRLVQIGTNTKVYAVTREAQFKEYPDTLFVIEVIVNKDGTPTGSYKQSSHGIMLKDIFLLLFRRTNKKGEILKMTRRQSLPPWEVTATAGHIAIKVIGFDSAIALYNVKDDKWNYTYFPYTEPFVKPPNSKAWRLIQGVYEPRWNATP